MLPVIQRRAACLLGLAPLAVLAFHAGWPRHLQDVSSQTGASTRQQTLPPPRDLYEEEKISFSAPPPSVIEGGMKCDQRGNLYLAYTDAPLQAVARERFPVQKLSPASKTITQFSIQYAPDYESLRRVDFDVDSRGRVYALVRAQHHLPTPERKEFPDFLIAKFSDDGTVDSIEKLQDPPDGRLDPYRFAAFLDTGFLVTGVIRSDLGRLLRPFTRLYDRNGKLVREVELLHDVGAAPSSDAGGSRAPAQDGGANAVAPQAQKAEDPAGAKPISWSFRVSQGRMVGAPDGSIYLARATSPPRLYAISPGGEVLREIEVKLPAEPALQAFEMSPVGPNSMFILFTPLATGRPGEGSEYNDVRGLVDLESGKVIATYRPPAGSGDLVAACATPSGEFLFVGASNEGKLEVVKFASR